MSTQELEPEYRYTFKQSARKVPDDCAEEPSKEDVQAYIFEVLGVKEGQVSKDES